MKLQSVYLRNESPFSNYIKEWASQAGIETFSYDFKPGEDQAPDGLLLINENQDIRRDIDEIHSYFDKKHIPTQKIDVNGTLQVAINSFKMWSNANKCTKILILGSDDVIKNDNLPKFLSSISGPSISSAF